MGSSIRSKLPYDLYVNHLQFNAGQQPFCCLLIQDLHFLYNEQAITLLYKILYENICIAKYGTQCIVYNNIVHALVRLNVHMYAYYVNSRGFLYYYSLLCDLYSMYDVVDVCCLYLYDLRKILLCVPV